MLPAALSHGIGSATQRRLACVIVGGVVSGTLLTLLLLSLASALFGNLADGNGTRASTTDAVAARAAACQTAPIDALKWAVA